MPTHLNCWKYIAYYVTLLHQLAVSQRPNFSPVKTCTQLTLKEIPLGVFDNCTGTGLVIHCLPDSHDKLGLSCYPPRWISKGKCPYYNIYQGNMDEKDCNPGIGNCPQGQFRSPLSVMYKGCYINEEQTVTTKETLTTTEVMKLTCKPVKSNCSSPVSAAGEVKSSSCTGEIVVCVVLAVIIFIGLLLFILVYKFRREATNIPCLQNSGSSGHESDAGIALQQEEPSI